MRKFILMSMTALCLSTACAPVQPTAGASVGSDGGAASVGAKSGRMNAGVGTRGAYASADVIDTKNVNVGVGTGGPSASMRVGKGPVKVGWGFGGWRVGI